MLIRRADLERIWAGEVTLAFRRWKRPTVKAGGKLRTGLGELRVGSVEQVTQGRLTALEARAAGFDSKAGLLAALGPHVPGRSL